MIQEKKDEHGEKYLTVVTEDDWHEALRRGRWVETPVQLAEQIGVPMDEDVGTLADIIAACADRWHWPLFLSLWGKSGTSYARRVSDDQAGGRALAEALEAGRTSRAGELLDRQAIHRRAGASSKGLATFGQRSGRRSRLHGAAV